MFILKAGLKIRRGHIDEASGAGLQRPVGGWCWGKGRRAIRNGMWANDPASVETHRGGGFAQAKVILLGGETCIAVKKKLCTV